MNRFVEGDVSATYRIMIKVAVCLCGVGLVSGTVFGQEKAVDPFESAEWQKQDLLAKAPETWEVMLEVFSVPFEEAAKLRREVKDAVKIYAELVKRVDGGKAKLEEFVILKGRIGEGGETESIEEFIYATEYEPPELPNIVTKVPSNPEVAALLKTPATPSAFDTRNLGVTLELDGMEKIAPNTIEVGLKVDRVSLVGRIGWGQGLSTAEMPKFELQRLNRQVILVDGKPGLLGTMSWPKSEGHAGKDRRVCLAFATTKPSVK